MNLRSFKKNKFLTHNHPFKAQIQTTIYFKIYCSNFSLLRSYNYPPMCKNSESVQFLFFLFFRHNLSRRHIFNLTLTSELNTRDCWMCFHLTGL